MEQAQSSPPLCKTGCGFYGSAQLEDLCSKCYKDIYGAVKSSQRTSRVSSDVAKPSKSIETVMTELRDEVAAQIAEPLVDDASSIPAVAPPKKRNRCDQCNKRVGLTGFPCRCGGMYCSEHRYDAVHNCSFDYKTFEREEIRKNNPVIECEKIQRI